MKIKPDRKAGGVVLELGSREAQLPSHDPGTALEPQPLFRLESILVPVDFSQCSQKALEYAVPFAKQFGARLALLHVIEPSVPTAEMMVVESESAAVATEKLKILQQEVRNAVPCTILLRTGSPPIEITGAASELGMDLIILSTHGRRGLEHVLLGSVAEKVVRQASCPVLVVREHEHEFIQSTEWSATAGMQVGKRL